MRILILGGTRFIGKALATLLIEAKQEVVVSSRKPQDAPVGCEVVGGERNIMIKRLAKKRFDCVVDFTCHGDEDAKAVLNAFPDARILFISTIWMTRLIPGVAANGLIKNLDLLNSNLPELTLNYLLNKFEAEKIFYDANQKGRLTSIIRLPIMWGEGDHTGRLDFYRARLLDDSPVIMVDGGSNLAQVGWSADIARCLANLVMKIKKSHPPIIEGLANEGLTVSNVLEVVAQAMEVKSKIVSISSKILVEHLPEYLDEEPLWREQGRALTGSNLFSMTNITPTPMQEWVETLTLPIVNSQAHNELRSKERSLMKTLEYS